VARVERIRFSAPETSPALLAPLAKAAGGTEACGKAVFTDRSDPDARLLAETLAKLAEEIRSNPREDMLTQRPPALDPQCRYIYRP
jgi:hypothetical protein